MASTSFHLYSNNLCSPVPTELQALSSSIADFRVTTGNAAIGTPCDEIVANWQSYMTDSRFPTMDGLVTTTDIDYIRQGITGTIPTQVGGQGQLLFWRMFFFLKSHATSPTWNPAPPSVRPDD